MKIFIYLTFAFLLPNISHAQWIFVDCSGIGIVKLNTDSKSIIPFVTPTLGTSDIAFTPDGSLYGIVATNKLYKIDTISGSMTFLKTINSSNTYIYGLASNYKGELITYGYDLINGLGEIIILNLLNNTETKLGYTGHEGWDLDFLDGNLYGICGNFNNSDFYLIDIDLNQPSSSNKILSYLNFSPLGGTSVYENCKGKLFATRHKGLLEYDLLNSAVIETLIPGLISPQGATSLTSWIGSLPPLAIDTVISSSMTFGCGSLSNITIHAKDRGIPIQYSIDGITYQNDSIFINKTPGKYHVFIRDTLGCTREDSITLDGVPVGYVEKIEVTDITCASINGQLSILAGYKEDMLSYSLDGVNYKTDTIFKNLSAGPGLLYVSSTSGCNDTITYNIGTVPLSDFTVKSKDIDCHILFGSVEIETQDDLLLFSLDGGSPQLYSIPWSGLMEGIHSIEIIDSNGCVVSEAVDIKNEPLPELDFILISPHCHLSDGSISTFSNQSKVQFQINYEGFQTNNTFNNLLSGEYLLTVMDSIGCISVATVNLVDIPGTQILSLDADVNKCDSTGSISFTNDNENPVLFILDNGSAQSSNIFSNIKIGIHQGIIIDALGCSDTMSVQLLPYTFPAINISSKNEACGQSNGVINMSPEGLQPFSYSINQTDYQSSNVFENLSAGTYKISVKDKNGCMISGEIQLINQGELQIDKVTSENDICDSGKGSITVQVNGSGTYFYKVDDGQYKNDSNFSGLSQGTYTIYVKDGLGCETSQTVTIDNKNTLEWTEARVSNASCGESNGTIHLAAISDSEILYSIDNDAFQGESLFMDLAKGSYLMKISNQSGCTLDTMIIVDNVGEITVDNFEINDANCGEANGMVVVLAQDNAENNLKYLLNEQQNTTGTFSDLIAGQYLLTIKNDYNCQFETSVLVDQSECSFFVPNIFSPNHDGINDIWEPNYDPTKIIITQASIYDRWGALVFSTKGGKVGWNGDFKTKPCNAGVYVYWIEYKDILTNTINMVKGDVTIMR